jgi:hypothetical protein
LRSELEAGHYDYRDGNGAVRLILAYLAEEAPTTQGEEEIWQTPIR